jgi:hypothetical protein
MNGGTDWMVPRCPLSVLCSLGFWRSMAIAPGIWTPESMHRELNGYLPTEQAHGVEAMTGGTGCHVHVVRGMDQIATACTRTATLMPRAYGRMEGIPLSCRKRSDLSFTVLRASAPRESKRTDVATGRWQDAGWEVGSRHVRPPGIGASEA